MSQPQGHCPSCKKPFTDGDDIVICPDCGAPYHRACYTREGQCVFSDKHGAGFEYTDPNAPKAPPPTAAQPPQSGQAQYRNQVPPGGQQHSNSGGTLCKNCHTVNNTSNIFCEKCGQPLRQPAGGAGGGAPPNGQGFGGAPPFGAPGQAGPGYAQPNMEGELSGIPKRDWAAYIGNSSPAYLYRMEQMERRGRKFSFMFSAFWLGGFYFAYRKLWGWAAAAMGMQLAVTSLQMLYWATQVGTGQILGLSAETVLLIYNIASYVYLIAKMVMGIFALYLYRGNGIKNITKLREDYTDPGQYQQALHRKGGVSMAGVVGAAALVVLFSAVMTLLLGSDMMMAIYNKLMGSLTL